MNYREEKHNMTYNRRVRSVRSPSLCRFVDPLVAQSYKYATTLIFCYIVIYTYIHDVPLKTNNLLIQGTM